MSIVRLLLISHNPQLASQLRSLLLQLTTVAYELDRRSPLDWPRECHTWSTDYALCLVDSQGLPNLPRDPDLLALLTQWQQDLAGVPLILIAKDLDFGRWAILSGIEDYWHLPTLNLDTVERSLRLLRRFSQTAPRPGLLPSLTELPASSAYYQSLLEHHSHALLGLDKCGRLIFANAIARQRLELPENYLGKDLADVYGGQLADKWLNDHEWVLRTRQPLEQIENFRDPHSQQLTVFSTLKRPLFSVTGEILGTQILLGEVTDQQKLQDRLHLLQTLLLEIDHHSDFTEALKIILQRICDTTGWQYGEVWLPEWDEDHAADVLRIGKAWYCNAPELAHYYEESKTFWFLPGEGLPGRVWVSKQPEWIEDVTQAESIHYFLRRELAQALQLKGALGVPIQMNGEVIAVVVFFTRYFWVDDPSLVEMVTAIAEQLGLVLARKQSEEKRQHQADQLRLIINALPVFIAYLDPQLRYQFVNRTYEDRLQKSPQEICGQSIEFVLGHEFYQQLLPKLRQAQQGQTVTYQAVIGQSATTRILVRANLIPDFDTNGKLQGIFLLAIELGTDGTPQLSF
jgi:PAS domain-containing protein